MHAGCTTGFACVENPSQPKDIGPYVGKGVITLKAVQIRPSHHPKQNTKGLHDDPSSSAPISPAFPARPHVPLCRVYVHRAHARSARNPIQVH